MIDTSLGGRNVSLGLASGFMFSIKILPMDCRIARCLDFGFARW